VRRTQAKPSKISPSQVKICFSGGMSHQAQRRRVAVFPVPKTVRQLFLGFLKPQSILCWRQVCTEFKDDQAASREVEITQNGALKMFVPLQVRTATLIGEGVSLAAVMGTLTNLHTIKLHFMDITLPDFEHLTNTNLRTVEFTRCEMNASASPGFTGSLAHIEVVTVDCADLPDISGLVYFTNVTSLSFSNCGKFTGFPNFPALRKLSFRDVIIEDAEIECVAKVTSLHELTVNHCFNMTDDSLIFLSKLPCLEHLRLSGLHAFTDAGLASFANHPTLTHLRLHGKCRFKQAALRHIASMRVLEDLSLFVTQDMLPGGFLDLSAWSNLTRVQLTYGKLLPLQIALPLRLRSVDLHLPLMTDAYVQQLLFLTNLEYVKLRGAREITDGAVSSLKQLPNLKRVAVHFCPKITAAAFQGFAQRNVLFSHL
jgi:hypothetical protein